MSGPSRSAAGDARVVVEVTGPFTLPQVLPGSGATLDPTYRARPDRVEFSGRSPDGPVTVVAQMTASARGAATVTFDAWGPGSAWMLARSEALVGRHDDPAIVTFGHDRLDELHRRHQGLRHGANGLVVDTLLARVIGQRVLAVEAGQSWRALCAELGGPAPGPLGLTLPPDPERILSTESWWFHRHGVEAGRATRLAAVARNARRLAEAVDLPRPEAYARMRAVPGIGPWSANGAARTALGDPDAIIVGDYWICHTVCSFFTGRPRGSDEEMLELVASWVGQRGRVERLIHRSGHRIQRFGPGKATPRIANL